MKSHVDDLRDRFQRATTDDERAKLLFAQEQYASSELVEFLLDVAGDPRGYDLTRIEAIKSAALSAHHERHLAGRVADALVRIAIDDADSDVQNYALQYLKWFPQLSDLPGRIAPALALDRDEDVRFAAYDVLTSHLSNPVALALLESLTDDADLGKYVRATLAKPRE